MFIAVDGEIIDVNMTAVLNVDKKGESNATRCHQKQIEMKMANIYYSLMRVYKFI